MFYSKESLKPIQVFRFDLNGNILILIIFFFAASLLSMLV